MSESDATTSREHTGSFGLVGRTAVVTGGGAGLGRAIAIGLAEHGATVAVADIDETGGTGTVELIEAAGGRASFGRCDVSSEADVSAFFDRAESELGPVTLLVNGAFTPVIERPQSLPLEVWYRAMSVNLTGYFLCAREAGQRMIERGDGGSILNISSIAGTTALGRGAFVYSVTKGGIVQMTRELAVEWARYGIRVNAIQPCQFRTSGLQARLDSGDADALMAKFVSAIPLGRIGEPPDIVGPVVFLLSDAARMVTGVLLPVDGGNLAMNAGGSHTD